MDSSKMEEHAREKLEFYVREWKIFMDTCSLLHPAADQFWMHVIPLLEKYSARVIVPLRSVEELQKHAANRENRDLARRANNTLKVLVQLREAGYIDIRGEKTDNFADNVFQVVFTKFRMTHRLLLITQDHNLAEDILSLNDSKSVRACSVNVQRVNRYGFLSGFKESGDRSRSDGEKADGEKESGEKESGGKDNDESEEGFRVCSQVTSVADTPMKVTHIPGAGERAYTAQGPIQLTEELASGGEGIIYATDTSYVAKIYKRGNITRRKYEKIRLMLEKPIACEGICAPVAALYNGDREFVGYLMPRARGRELQKSIFIKPLFIKYFPGWKKRDTVQLCVTILEKIRYLHERNIIIGDINPANILVVSPREVYFVDTDSYQIEDFPCPVGTINYTAPEIQGKHFPEFLRTMGNENFAIATLLFMIMLPGKPPYSQQGGENPIANIVNMDFSYPFGENSNRKTPDGPWRYIWSHLTYDLKKAFYNTFKKGGENAGEDTRLSVDEWLPVFRYYLELLDSGRYGKQDQMSEELYPTRHKKNPKTVFVTCKLCGNEVAENMCQNGICRECLNRGEEYGCRKCGRMIRYTNYQKYIKNAKRYDICTECYEQGKKIKYSLSCVDCGEVFQITNSQYDYFMEKGFDLPKRCPSCRAEKRKRMEEENFLPGGQSDDDNGSFCFITTAVCRYYGKPDDCRELTLLRAYRDTWLKNRPGGPEAIAEYYQKAPLLVSLLQASEQYGEICERLWTGYIRPCTGLIEGAMSEEGMFPGPGRPIPADTSGTRTEKTMLDGTGNASGTRTEAILNGTDNTGGTRAEAILNGTGDTGGTGAEAILDGTGSASGTRAEAILDGTGDTGGTGTEATLDGTDNIHDTQAEAMLEECERLYHDMVKYLETRLRPQPETDA